MPKQAISETQSDPSPTRPFKMLKNGPQSARNDTKGFFKASARLVQSSANDSDDSVSELRRADHMSDDEEEKGEKVIQHIHVQRDFGEYDSDINDDSNDDKLPRSKTDS